jgi:hypothetical protein
MDIIVFICICVICLSFTDNDFELMGGLRGTSYENHVIGGLFTFVLCVFLPLKIC